MSVTGEVDFHRFFQYLDLDAEDREREAAEKRKIDQFRGDTPFILLRSLRGYLPADKSSQNYARKHQLKVIGEESDTEVNVEDEDDKTPAEYRCVALIQKGPILHTIGTVGFTVAEYFYGNLRVKPVRTSQVIVSVHHAEIWSKHNPNKERLRAEGWSLDLETLEDHIKYRSVAVSTPLPFYIRTQWEDYVRLARLSPFQHAIVSDPNFVSCIDSCYKYLINTCGEIKHLKWNEFLEVRGLKGDEVTAPFPAVRSSFSSHTDLWDLV